MTAKEIIGQFKEIVKERDTLKDQCNYLETMVTHYREQSRELKEYRWRPISTFDHRLFSLMSTGIPDSMEVVKYKGEIPSWAAWWHPIPIAKIPRNEELAALLSRPVTSLRLSLRCSNCLNTAKIKTIGKLVKTSERELMAVRNFGKKCLYEITDSLSNIGLELDMEDLPV